MKKLSVLLVVLFSILLNACFNQSEKKSETETFKQMLLELVELEKISKRAEGDVLNGIYLNESEKIFFYSIQKLEETVGSEAKILEFISKVNSSDLNKSYVVYNNKSIIFTNYSGAKDFNLESKYTNANQTIGQKTIVYNVELLENRYADGTVVDIVIVEAKFENKKEIYGMGYEYDVYVTVNTDRVNVIKIDGASDDINVVNRIANQKILIDNANVIQGYTYIYAMSGNDILETKRIDFNAVEEEEEEEEIPETDLKKDHIY